jgi:hypothetical protein
MAVAITQTADPAGVSTSANVATYSAVSIGTAAHDRVVVVCVGGEVTTNTPDSATIDYGAGAVAMSSTALATFGSMRARIFYLHVGGAATTATIAVTWSGATTNVQNHIAVYSVTGAKGALNTSGTNTSTDMDTTAPLTTGSSTIPASGGMIAVAVGATDGTAKTWAQINEDLDEDAGDFRFTTATSTTAGTATRTCTGGTNNEDGAMAWVIFDPNASVERLPGQGNLALSPTAPTAVRTVNVDLSPASANLAFSTVAPSLVVDVRRDPASANLALSPTAPSIAIISPARAVVSWLRVRYVPGNSVAVSPSSVNLTLSTVAPSVVQDIRRDPATADLSISTTAPSRVTDERRDPAAADLSISTVAPTVVQTTNVDASPATVNLSLSSTAPTVIQTTAVDASPNAAQLSLSAQAPSVIQDVRRDPASANLNLTTTAPDLSVTEGESVDRSPAAANLALSTVAPTVVQTTIVSAVPATADLALSTVAPSIVQTTSVSAFPATANLALSSAAPTLVQTTNVDAVPATAQLTLSTTAPTIVADGNVSVSPDTANLNLSTVAPSVSVTGQEEEFSGFPAIAPPVIEGDGYGIIDGLFGDGEGVVGTVATGRGRLAKLNGRGQAEAAQPARGVLKVITGCAVADYGLRGEAVISLKSLNGDASLAIGVDGSGSGRLALGINGMAVGQHDDDEAAITLLLVA